MDVGPSRLLANTEQEIASPSVDRPGRSVPPGEPGLLAVAEAMITSPQVAGVTTTVGHAAAFFVDDHVHALLIVDQGRLEAVVERADMARGHRPDTPALAVGQLRGRVIGPNSDLELARAGMVARKQRRLAVVDKDYLLLGLLCLKRSARGFCSDAGILSRAAERHRASTIGAMTVERSA
jgi:CBS domain